MSSFHIVIVGNPNVGKSSLFNILTGVCQKVANWPGVTVDKREGTFSYKGQKFTLVDLPGIYSLSAASIDECIARDYILEEKPDLIINILDASNLERNLYMTAQLLEMRIPVVIALNMVDQIQKKNIKIDVEQLSELLDCAVINTQAHKNRGIDELKEAVFQARAKRRIAQRRVEYSAMLEEAVTKIRDVVLESGRLKHDPYFIASKLLEGERASSFPTGESIEQVIQEARENLMAKHNIGDVDIEMADYRYGFVHSICCRVVDHTQRIRHSLTDTIDRVVLNKFLGLPIFLFAMYMTFWITINLGGCFIDFFDVLAGAIFVDGLKEALSSVGISRFFQTLLAEGVGGGIQTVATFIPPIFFIFLCLTFLEDSGYMTRAAFIMDRFMRKIGLPGKAFLPLMVGFGCNVPSIMAARALPEEKDRITTVMMAPFMSCGARMPVYALFAAAFFPQNGGFVVFSLYLIGILLAVATGYLLKRTILKTENPILIMELPPYHVPNARTILLHTWQKLKTFIVNAGKIIVMVIMILNLLNSIGTDGSFGHHDSEKSVLSKIGQSITPAFAPMGMSEDNWPAAVGIFTGIFAKEAIIGTLDSLYSQMDAVEVETDGGLSEKEEPFSLNKSFQRAWATVPENFSDLAMPFSLVGLIGADVNTAIEELNVEDATYAAITSRFDGQVGAFAYLLMILLYMPCVAAIGAVYRELNLGWTIFASLYLTALAWVSATLFYQAATFLRHPQSSLSWILSLGGAILLFIWAMAARGRKFYQGQRNGTNPGHRKGKRLCCAK